MFPRRHVPLVTLALSITRLVHQVVHLAFLVLGPTPMGAHSVPCALLEKQPKHLEQLQMVAAAAVRRGDQAFNVADGVLMEFRAKHATQEHGTAKRVLLLVTIARIQIRGHAMIVVLVNSLCGHLCSHKFALHVKRANGAAHKVRISVTSVHLESSAPQRN